MAVTVVVNASNTDNRFVVTDISNPANPNSVYVTAPFDTGEMPTAGCVVDCYGKLAAVGSYQTAGVALYDLTIPAQPVLKSLIDTAFQGIGAISLDGNYLLVGEANGPHVALIDVSNPAGPLIVSSQIFSGLGDQSTPGLTGLGLRGLVAVASDYFSVVVLDYSSPSAPQQLPYVNYKINFQGPIVCAFDGFTAAVSDSSGTIYLFSVPNGVPGGITLQNQFGSGIGGITSIAIQGNVVAVASSIGYFACVAYLTPDLSSAPALSLQQIGTGDTGPHGGGVKFYGLPANLAISGINTPGPLYADQVNTVTWFSISNSPQFNVAQTGSHSSSPSLNEGLGYTLGVASFETLQLAWWSWIWRTILAPFRSLFR